LTNGNKDIKIKFTGLQSKVRKNSKGKIAPVSKESFKKLREFKHRGQFNHLEIIGWSQIINTLAKSLALSGW